MAEHAFDLTKDRYEKVEGVFWTLSIDGMDLAKVWVRDDGSVMVATLDEELGDWTWDDVAKAYAAAQE